MSFLSGMYEGAIKPWIKPSVRYPSLKCYLSAIVLVKGLVPLYKRRQVTKLREPIVLLRFRRSAHPSLTTCGV